MAKKRATKRKTESTVSENDENHTETNSVENGVEGPSKTPKGKKKKLVATAKTTPKNDTPSKSKGRPSKAKAEESEEDDDKDYEVEKILDINYKKNNKREFLIRWKNYSSKHDSWEPEENLACDELITKFLEVQEQKAKQPRKELRDKPKTVSRYVPPGARKSKRTAGARKSYAEEDDE